jgi:GrpB-like predicted nucleotidyltransferase (UPF0157 family)
MLCQVKPTVNKVWVMKRVLVVPYDPRWPEAFSLSSSAVASAMGANLLAIHHIGSTAIEGMHAKPVIDMLAVVTDIVTVDHRATQMESLGYEAMGEFGIPGRRYFRRDNTAGERTHQVHTFQNESPDVQRHLAFRDFMRAHTALAAQYSELKQSLAKAHPHDIEAYMDGKDAFIKEMEARALAWAASGCGQPAT